MPQIGPNILPGSWNQVTFEALKGHPRASIIYPTFWAEFLAVWSKYYGGFHEYYGELREFQDKSSDFGL